MALTRATFLPNPGDPFLLTAWFENYKKNFQSEGGNLYIHINSHDKVSRDITDYLKELLSGKVHSLTFTHERMNHGRSLYELYKQSDEDVIFFIEDDAIVYKPGFVEKGFRKIEQGEADLVGSPRRSCSQGIWDRAKEVFDLDYSGYGDKGPNFWPCFVFVQRKHIENTDKWFGNTDWPKGTTIPYLNNYLTEADESGDTFVSMSLQLRAQNLKVFEMPQGHSSSTDLIDIQNSVNMFDPHIGWYHIGSLSPLHRHFFCGEPVPPKENMAISEWERTLAWLKTIYYKYGDMVAISNESKKDYTDKIHYMIKTYSLSMDRISKLMDIYTNYI